MPAPMSTASVSAAGLIGGYAVAVITGSRPAGGVVLALCAVVCVLVWLRRHGRRLTVALSACGVTAFVLSHVLGLVIGAWPAVLSVAAAMAALCWWMSDRRQSRPASRTPARA